MPSRLLYVLIPLWLDPIPSTVREKEIAGKSNVMGSGLHERKRMSKYVTETVVSIKKFLICHINH